MNHRVALPILVLLSGCLTDPELPTCAEFPLGQEGCGTPCEVYCELMLSDCSEVYNTQARCMNDCANEPVTPFVVGTQGDREGNSLSCRISYALEGECAEASLNSTSQCTGASCGDYCDLMMSNCEGAYPSVDYCLSVCGALAPGSLAVDANTVACRLSYAEQTATDPSACDAASMSGGNVCGDPCEVYCDFLDMNCTEANAVYADRSTCLSTCNLLDKGGGVDDWSFSLEFDTVQCRLYHAGPPAVLEPATHCNHAGVYNSVHCGVPPGGVAPPTWPCITYCDLVMEHCPGVYASDLECETMCALIPEVLAADPATGPDIYPVASLTCPM